jgi:hypothetical protein
MNTAVLDASRRRRGPHRAARRQLHNAVMTAVPEAEPAAQGPVIPTATVMS